MERLETYKPAWPLPKIFRMTKGGKLNEGIFEGETINTPSMLCVEDYLDALNWAKSVGGLKALIARADANTKVLADWKAKTPWIDFLAKDPAIRSNTSVCLKFIDPAITSLTADAQADFSKKLVALVEKEGAGYDFAYYRDAPAGLRIWCGATVEAERRRAADAVDRLGVRRDQGRAAEGGLVSFSPLRRVPTGRADEQRSGERLIPHSTCRVTDRHPTLSPSHGEREETLTTHPGAARRPSLPEG